MIDRLCGRHLVLMGIGHTNAHIVRMWGMQPISNTDLTCISDRSIVTYSGRLPAVLAGQIPESEMEIDLVRLCSSVGARLIIDEVIGLNHDRREIEFADRPSISFDVLSIGIGSVPVVVDSSITSDSIVKIKPMQTFLQRLQDAVQQRSTRKASDASLKVLIVGSGVAAMEILFCSPTFLRSVSDRDFTFELVSRSPEITSELTVSARRHLERELDRRGVKSTLGRSVVRVEDSSVELDDGTRIDADLVIWSTGAAAPPTLSRLGLPQDDRGFLATDRTLRSTLGEPIFAVGDTGTIVRELLPKAGVYAVRQGPVLWQNIVRTLAGQSLIEYEPQRSFLKLINLGNGRAIGQWKGFSFSGRWVMRLKERIDSNFMQKYRLEAMAMADAEMQCHGCGCKLEAEILQSAISGTGAFDQSSAKLEDAAPVGVASEDRLLASIDFFTPPVDDAFTFGRMAALHAASDIIASGARVTQALANVVIQEGDSETQRRYLADFLAGARNEFSVMGAMIVGGHTIVGPRPEAGFTVVGSVIGAKPIRKANLRVGDTLYLTKPLGIGVLLAGLMRSQLEAGNYETLLQTMLMRQHAYADIAANTGVVAGTDVTGFGFAGHLHEMLLASSVSAVIDIDQIQVLPGARTLIDSGIESSLGPGNSQIESKIDVATNIQTTARYRVLFDPQTCGGLLFGIAAENEARFLESADQQGMPTPMRVGEVTSRGSRPIVIVGSLDCQG